MERMRCGKRLKCVKGTKGMERAKGVGGVTRGKLVTVGTAAHPAMLALTLAFACAAASASEPLGVCADPNNLPFSDEAGRGFENELAELLGDALDRDVVFTWHPQRRGFIRNTLNAGVCDVVIGVPADYELARPTDPYYTSTYVFVTRQGSGIDIESLDDPALRKLRVGVHAVGDDYSSTPGAAALGRRGIIDNMVGYSIYGDYDEPHPPSRLIEAVAEGEVDVAIAWGPLAGYFASRQAVPLEIEPVTPSTDAFIDFVFDISMAVRDDDDALHARLNQIIAARGAEIDALLERYGVPLAERPPQALQRQPGEQRRAAVASKQEEP